MGGERKTPYRDGSSPFQLEGCQKMVSIFQFT